ncbi:MAG: GTP 3',8-cyclase MoaA [Coriobacteriia bacterium]|nr:GTP 3',8-cyclase MoaA [Coriobacteriia bacterium]
MATDAFGRRIDYLRVSLTDRCNLRCLYCMPDEGVPWKPHEEILTLEEVERFARVAVEEGISKIRLTGGEPLVRHGVVGHVRRLLATTGIESIALTTNGILLPRYAAGLAEAGLRRVNVSLDSLDAEVYERVTRGGRLADALAGIDAAFDVGFDPVKVNVVVARSLEQDLLAFARLTLDRPVHVRFIEYMPIGAAETSGCGGSATSASEAGAAHGIAAGAGAWSEADHVPSAEILASLAAQGAAAGLGELRALGRSSAPGGWGPARYYRFDGAVGTLGVISPLSHHFCGECNRLRLTADGRLRPCLFSDDELDVRVLMRSGASDEDVRALIRAALAAKPATHGMRVGTARRMYQIGG